MNSLHAGGALDTITPECALASSAAKLFLLSPPDAKACSARFWIYDTPIESTTLLIKTVDIPCKRGMSLMRSTTLWAQNTMCSGIVRPPIKVLVWLSFCELGSFAHGREVQVPIQQPVVPAVRRMMDNALRKFPFASSGFLNPVFDASLLRTCM